MVRECSSCKGHWIGEVELEERLRTMPPPHTRYLAWKRVDRETLRCALCNGAMLTFTLWDVPVDRCRHHGVWFDANELRTVLLRGAKPLGPSSDTAPSTGQASPADSSSAGGASPGPVSDAATYLASETVGGAVGAVLELVGDLIAAIDLDG
ncbi:MAG: zf-TFIIB domain-containing protein [Kofleriaceae bacterium]